MSAASESLRRFIDRARCFKVTQWSTDSSNNDALPDRYEASANNADVVSSRIKGAFQHQLVLDIDHEAWLVKSTTPGHFHLYINVPGGIDWTKYGTMMLAMAAAGVLEEGYVKASISRGYSSVRLPWVKKVAVNLHNLARITPLQADFAAIEQRVRDLSRSLKPMTSDGKDNTALLDIDWDGL